MATKSADLFEQALRELEPKWASFEGKKLKYYQWAWEFLRRNPYYIRAHQNHIRRNHDASEQLARFIQAREESPIAAHIPMSLYQDEMGALTALEEMIAHSFGLKVLIPPESEIATDHVWIGELAQKAHSDIRLLMAYDFETRTVNNFKLEDGDHLIVVNKYAPRKPYDDELDRIFASKKDKSKPKTGKGRDIKKYPDYIKTYDLHMWGKQEGRSVKKQGEYKSCIEWRHIADYLKLQRKPSADSTVIGYLDIAEDMIHGGYKRFLKRKGTV